MCIGSLQNLIKFLGFCFLCGHPDTPLFCDKGFIYPSVLFSDPQLPINVERALRSLEAEAEASFVIAPRVIITGNSGNNEVEPNLEILFVVDLSENPNEDSFEHFENSLKFSKNYAEKVSQISAESNTK